MINHKYTSNIVCPHCGTEDHDSWERSPGEEDLGLIECDDCGKHFYATRSISVDYTTQKATYGTCKHCGTVDVPIENWHSSLGEYSELCVSCGEREKQCLATEYAKQIRGVDRDG